MRYETRRGLRAMAEEAGKAIHFATMAAAIGFLFAVGATFGFFFALPLVRGLL